MFWSKFQKGIDLKSQQWYESQVLLFESFWTSPKTSKTDEKQISFEKEMKKMAGFSWWRRHPRQSSGSAAMWHCGTHLVGLVNRFHLESWDPL